LDASVRLASAGIRATVFVCPGVVDTREPLWWQVVDRAIQRGVVPEPWRNGDPAAFRATLKKMPDADRRDAVEQCQLGLRERGDPTPDIEQVSTADLLRWIADGHHVGNHTWDHPLLDKCSEADQRGQITAAHEWLRERLPGQPLVFAYPNGNSTSFADGVARGLGYEVRLLFDHRVAGSVAAHRPVSRLRLDSDAAPNRMRAIASGAHSVAFSVWQR
jgi:peptidoglycan/xylan/chitin deacetylase (PgdA/CDA1 family)